MTRTVYVNGEYLPENEAKVSIFDRGFLFADGVYEVTSVLGGKLIDFAGHAKRLERSLNELEMANPISTDDLLEVHRQLVERNGITDGLIYLQITRGAPDDRDFAFPPADTTPTIVLFTQNKPGLADAPQAKTGMKVISVEDLRWGRRDIKTVQLLYPSLGALVSLFKGYDHGYQDLIPPYVVLTSTQGRFPESGFLGPAHQPLATGGAPHRARLAAADALADAVHLGRRLTGERRGYGLVGAATGIEVDGLQAEHFACHSSTGSDSYFIAGYGRGVAHIRSGGRTSAVDEHIARGDYFQLGGFYIGGGYDVLSDE